MTEVKSKDRKKIIIQETTYVNNDKTICLIKSILIIIKLIELYQNL